MLQGTVKWFNPVKNFGFIEQDGEDEQDMFVHGTSILDGAHLHEGDRVEYEVEEGPNGKPCAKNVRVIENE